MASSDFENGLTVPEATEHTGFEREESAASVETGIHCCRAAACHKLAASRHRTTHCLRAGARSCEPFDNRRNSMTNRMRILSRALTLMGSLSALFWAR